MLAAAHAFVRAFAQVRVVINVERDGTAVPDGRMVFDGKSLVRFGKSPENDVVMDHATTSRLVVDLF